MRAWMASLFFCLTSPASAELTSEASRSAALIIGQWLTQSSSHFDFLPASPIAPKRAGEKFFVRGSKAPLQTGSDYGVSTSLIPIDNKVTEAYYLLGFNGQQMSESISVDRIHTGFGLGNFTDLSLSYFHGIDGFRGWGVGLKRVLIQNDKFYYSYRLQYGRSQLENYFETLSINQDLLVSYYLRLVDFYVGVRHSSGSIQFKSTQSVLQLPSTDFVDSLQDLDLFLGITIATSLNTRFTLQAQQVGQNTGLAAKISLHFDSLFPTKTPWFGDARALKQ